MKKLMHSLAVFLLVGTVSVAEAAWTYDPSAGTLTDGVWGLKATLVSKTTDQLDIDGSTATCAGSGPVSMDLTTITDSAGNAYKAVSFAKALKNTHKTRLSEFIAPDCKIITGASCFNGFTALTKVQLNETVESLAARAFSGCTALDSFYPRTLHVTDIAISCFNGCSKLSGSFSFPDFKGNATGGWFSGCSSLEEVLMPKATQICGTAFQSCSSLTNVEVSADLTKIGKLAFSGCSSLKGDCIRAILHSGITFLGGNAETDSKEMFMGCASFDGAFEWNFPDLTSTNVIGSSFFKDCTSLTRVDILSNVLEIRGSAMKNLAPGAEVYMPATVPQLIGAEAVARTAAPYARVYLRDGYDGWLDAFRVNHHVFLKDDFNNADWFEYVDGSKRTRDAFVKIMAQDTEMCSFENNVVKTRKKDVLAFVVLKRSGAFPTSAHSYCWVLKERKPRGLILMVR